MAVQTPPARTATPPRVSRSVIAGLAVVATAQIVATYALLGPGHLGLTLGQPQLWLPLTVVPYAIGVIVLARSGLPARATGLVILGVTALLQFAALTSPPQTSNDDLRYIWDGKVQLAGVDPYRYVPDAPELARLHEPLLFTHLDCPIPTGCALLNRPEVHTIYPPVAQSVFDLVRILSFGGHGGQRAFQVAAALGVILITALMLRRARRRRTPMWHVALWGWCPVVVSEFGNNAHIDWAAILLSFGAIAAYVALRPVWAGALLGGAIATKLYPALIAPALLRRHPVRVAGAAAGVVALGYVPHVAAVGAKVIGYFPGYLHEEGYSSGSRLLLIGRIVPHPFDTITGLLLLAILALVCYRTTDPERPEMTAVWLVGAAFLIASPNYGWYAGLLVALVAMSGRWHWLPVAFAPTCTYLYGHSALADSGIYAAAAVVTALAFLVARFLQGRRGAFVGQRRVPA